MKKSTKILYWVFTGLFSLAMFSSAVPNVMMNDQSIELISKGLGFPEYMIFFIGVAKILGVIGILIPGFPIIKEWAYAGLFFDLIGATYAGIAKAGFQPEMSGMLIFFALGGLSYFYYHKRLKETVAA